LFVHIEYLLQGNETVGVERTPFVLIGKNSRGAQESERSGGRPQRCHGFMARPEAKAAGRDDIYDCRRRGREQKCAILSGRGPINPVRKPIAWFPVAASRLTPAVRKAAGPADPGSADACFATTGVTCVISRCALLRYRSRHEQTGEAAMTKTRRDRLIATSVNVIRLEDHRPPPAARKAGLSDFDARLEVIARMFLEQRALQRASASSRCPSSPTRATVCRLPR
jgi:hypothetical protein